MNSSFCESAKPFITDQFNTAKKHSEKCIRFFRAQTNEDSQECIRFWVVKIFKFIKDKVIPGLNIFENNSS